MAGQPLLLDLYCCEGGVSEGYRRAGFDVVGVDRFRYRDNKGKLQGFRRQRYPFHAHQGDCLAVMRRLLDGHPIIFTGPSEELEPRQLYLDDFAAAGASPPCQAYSISKNAHKSSHPELIEPTRELLIASGLPYVMENVEGAKRQMESPMMLCGTMFDLRATDTDGLEVWLKRHRLFESNIFLYPPSVCDHPKDILCAGVYGNGSPSRDAAKARAGGYTPPSQQVRADLMGIDWMSRNGLSQAIPPVYTEHIGRQLMAHLESVAA